jgi:hypothetical protein
MSLLDWLLKKLEFTMISDDVKEGINRKIGALTVQTLVARHLDEFNEILDIVVSKARSTTEMSGYDKFREKYPEVEIDEANFAKARELATQDWNKSLDEVYESIRKSPEWAEKALKKFARLQAGEDTPDIG